MQEVTESTVITKTDLLATKEDIYLLESKINFKIHSELDSVGKDIQDSKDNIYRAIYLSGILQFIDVIGALLALVKWIKP